MISSKNAEKLHQHILSLPDFQFVTPEAVGGGGYNHIGAIVVDSILQSHANWEKIVKPRVESVLERYRDLSTTSQFSALLTKDGKDPHEALKTMVRWNGNEKPERILKLLQVLHMAEIETVAQLNSWLVTQEAEVALRSIHGVGPKTVDYLKILAGVDTAAVDVWWWRFLYEAGLSVRKYEEASAIIAATALLFGVPTAVLDHSVWKYARQAPSAP